MRCLSDETFQKFREFFFLSSNFIRRERLLSAMKNVDNNKVKILVEKEKKTKFS